MSHFNISTEKTLAQYNSLTPYCDSISYSSKTNQNVTRILEENTNSLFSVHFVNELKHITDCSRVIFLAQGWTEEQIASLLERGIRQFVVDNETDLDILLAFFEQREEQITLFLRWKLKEHTIRTEKYYVFGMQTRVIEQRVNSLKEHPHITLGLHFHRKTQNMAEWNLRFELEHAFSETTLRAFNYVNIGGGLPVAYANTNIDVLPSILHKIGELRDWLHSLDLQLMLEPGRYIAAPAGTLHTKVLAVNEQTIIVDASVYNGDLDALIVPVKLLIKGEKDDGTAYIVKGVTPCSMDIFRYKVYLDEVKVGDELVFLNAGAYNFNSDFCDLEPMETRIE